MPRVKSPEIITGARGERTAETVTHIPGPEVAPAVLDKKLKKEQVHFVSRFKEYAIVIATQPDYVNSSGQIVRGMNKAVRFKEFNLVTSDSVVIEKIRTGMGRAYGLGSEVWEKWQQDQDLAQKALATAEAAIDALPEEMKAQFAERLKAKFNTFALPARTSKGAKEAPAEAASPAA